MVMRAAHPVCRSDRSEFLAAVVAALDGCVSNDALVSCWRRFSSNTEAARRGSTKPNRWPSAGLPGGLDAE
jgi:hypothetical protein